MNGYLLEVKFTGNSHPTPLGIWEELLKGNSNIVLGPCDSLVRNPTENIYFVETPLSESKFSALLRRKFKGEDMEICITSFKPLRKFKL